MEPIKKIPLLFSLLTVFIVPYYFPSLPLIYFAPYLCSLLHAETTLERLISISFCLGLCLDLLSSHYLFGSYALIYTLTTALVFRSQNLFFDSKPLSFSLEVAFFALIFTLMSTAINFFQHPRFPLSFISLTILIVETLLIHFTYGYIWKTAPIAFKLAKKQLLMMVKELKTQKKQGFKAWFRAKKL